MSAISVSTGPAARGADGIRGSLVGPTRRLGARGSIHGNALVNGTVPRSKLDPYALQLRNRYAAKSLGGSSGVGYFGEYGLAGTTSLPYDVSFSYTIASTTPPATACRFHGRADGNRPSTTIGTDGALALHLGATVISATAAPAGTINFAGVVQVVTERWTVTSTTAAVSVHVNGVQVYNATVAGSYAAASSNHRIGASASGTQRWPGAIWNFEFTDHNTAANSRVFLMDEPPSSASWADSSGNGGAAMTKATGLAFPWVASVASTDGRGMPAQPVGPLVYLAGGDTDTTGITGVTTYTPATVGTEIDPTGSLALCVLTAPFTGYAVVSFCGAIAATTLAGTDNIFAKLTPSSGVARTCRVRLPSANTEGTFAVTGIFPLNAGQTLTAEFSSMVAGDVYTLFSGWGMQVQFHPTPTTG